MLFLLHAGAAAPLTIGSLQGSATFGQPLRLTLPLSAAPGEDLGCLRADLLQAETLPTPLDLRLEGADDQHRVLRLATSKPPVEPVVTVRVSLGCERPFTRSFILLSNPPAQAAVQAAAATEPAQAPPVARPRAPESRTSKARRDPAPVSGASLVLSAPAAAARAPALPAAPAVAAAPPRAADARPVEPLPAPTVEPPWSLKPSVELSTLGAQGLLPRAEAELAWSLWHAPPDPRAQRAAQATQEAAVRQLRELAQAQARQLAQATGERDLLRQLVAGACALVALGFGWLLWARTRSTPQSVAWNEPTGLPSVPAELGATQRAASAPFVPGSTTPLAPTAPVAPGSAPAMPLPALDFDMTPSRSDGFAIATQPLQAVPQAAGDSSFGDRLGDGRPLRVEELLDVLKRTGFYVAIGMHEQGGAMLESQLQDHPGSGPYLWLELLDLCRRLGRPHDYERVRGKFESAFGVPVPEPDPPTGVPVGLEGYPDVLTPIVQLWPSRDALAAIEAALSDPPVQGGVMFDLEASRELLALHAIGTELAAAQPPADATDDADLLAFAVPGSADGELSLDLDLTTPPAAPTGGTIGIDLDLDAPVPNDAH